MMTIFRWCGDPSTAVDAMVRTTLVSQIIEPMIELARCVKSHRIIVAGSKSREVVFELHHRGYVRATTPAACEFPTSQCSVAFLDWRLDSINLLEKTLGWLVRFLAPAAVLVIWVDSSEPTGNRKLRSMLERLGFCIEAGTKCEQGFAMSARRRDAVEMNIAA